MEWLETVRYDHPGVFRGVVACAVVVGAVLAFLALPESPLLRAMGITGAQKRISAAANGLYWEARAWLGTPGTETPVRLYGNMEGLDRAGRVIVSIAEGDHWVKRHFALADAQIEDMYGAAQIVGALRTEHATFDVYGESVVAWIHGVPVNIKLVEAGVARPDPHPPTNIVDRIFATYYWTVAKGHVKGET